MKHGTKLSNEYVDMLGYFELYKAAPKAVLAAIVVSLLHQRRSGKLVARTIKIDLLAEWKVLHENGIVPQEPPDLGKIEAAEAKKKREVEEYRKRNGL